MANTDKKDGELGGDRELGDIGVVLKNFVVSDELHEVVKHVRGDAQLFSKLTQMVVPKVGPIQVQLTCLFLQVDMPPGHVLKVAGLRAPWCDHSSFWNISSSR